MEKINEAKSNSFIEYEKSRNFKLPYQNSLIQRKAHKLKLSLISKATYPKHFTNPKTSAHNSQKHFNNSNFSPQPIQNPNSTYSKPKTYSKIEVKNE
jgi:hypothetical protein